MDRLKRTFSFRKKKKKCNIPEASKPHQWQEDERKVRDATCSFQVKYLGTIEVFESRGMQVCEEAIKSLKSGKGKHQRAVLYVSGDALRVVDEISKGLIVDQTIEKVSFCAPDRHHDKGFAYICRDGATKRWMCHGFLAVKESGERLSHAVGCAFAICLEKKQKREKEAVEVQFSDDRTSFARMGSFRQTTLTEKMQDPQSAIIAEPITAAVGGAMAALPKSPNKSASGDGAAGGVLGPGADSVPRPHASVSMLDRQGSLRIFPKLVDNAQSPFKRNLSLRLQELPSTVARQHTTLSFNGQAASIPEDGPATANGVANGATADATVLLAASDFSRQLTALTEEGESAAPSWPPATNPFPVAPRPAVAKPPPGFTPQSTNPWAAEAWQSSGAGGASWETGFPNNNVKGGGGGGATAVKAPVPVKPYSPFPDPFDLAWAASSTASAGGGGRSSTNPFAQAAGTSGATKAFEVQM